MGDDEQRRRDEAIENEMRIIQGMLQGKRPGDVLALYDTAEMSHTDCIKKVQLVMLDEVNQEHSHLCQGQKITKLGPRLIALSVLLGRFLFEMLKFHDQYRAWPRLIKCEPELSAEIRRWNDTGLLFEGQLLGIPWVQSDLDLGAQGFVFSMPSETPPMPSHEIM